MKEWDSIVDSRPIGIWELMLEVFFFLVFGLIFSVLAILSITGEKISKPYIDKREKKRRERVLILGMIDVIEIERGKTR